MTFVKLYRVKLRQVKVPALFFGGVYMSNLKRVIIYCRESRDETGEYIERIETQRDILLKFCKNNDFTNIIDIVMDNNVSGTKFERLDEIVEKIKSKAVDVLVFKDASRLGRNLLESLKFIELAEEYGVEVLFESEKYSEELFPLLAWFNEQRAREDSKKIRRVMQHKMETGELLIKPIYGYKKVGNKLIPDPNAAPIVKRIFEMYVEGKGTRQIATILNYEGVPTPSQHNRTPRISNVWVQQQVYRMINNRMYIGEMEYRKTQKKNFKSKKVIKTSSDQRIIVKEHHEAIISKDLFEQAQLIKSQFSIKSRKEISPFSGLLKCGRCGRSLIRRKRGNNESYYECIKYHQEGALKPEIKDNYGCVSHRISEGDVLKIVYDYCIKILSNDELISRVYNLFDDEFAGGLHCSVNKSKFEIKKYKKIIEQLYDDKLNGLISSEMFINKFREYQEKIIKLERQINEISSIKRINSTTIRDVIAGIEQGDLENYILKLMIDKIVYYLPNEIKVESKDVFNISEDYYNALNSGGLLFNFR